MRLITCIIACIILPIAIRTWAADIQLSANALSLKQLEEHVAKEPALISAKDRKGNTILHNLFENAPRTGGDLLDKVRFLVKSGADVNGKNKWGDTPLHAALEESQHGLKAQKVVELLLELGADPEMPDSGGSPQMLSANAELAELILNKKKVTDQTLKKLTKHTIINAWVEEAKVYVTHGALKDFTAHETAATGGVDRIQEIYSQDASLFSKYDQFGFLPVHWAAFLGNLDSLKKMKSLGLDPHAQSRKDQLTPLHLAAYGGNAEVVKFLLETGADPIAKARMNMFDKTPLDLAKARYQDNCVAILQARVKPDGIQATTNSLKTLNQSSDRTR